MDEVTVTNTPILHKLPRTGAPPDSPRYAHGLRREELEGEG